MLTDGQIADLVFEMSGNEPLRVPLSDGLGSTFARKCSRPRCGGDMLPGVAMGQTFTGMADFPGSGVVTMSPGGPGAIVQCLKCNACGHSVSVEHQR